MKQALLKAVLEASRERRAVAVVTTIENGAQRLVAKENLGGDPLGAVLEEAFRFDQSGLYGGEFVHIYNPPLRLVIIGAVHIAQSVIPMARQAGYDITVIDPRGAFATGARFPDITLHITWPEDVLPGLGVDARTALLALTHDPKIDDPALSIALKSECFYIRRPGLQENPGEPYRALAENGIFRRGDRPYSWAHRLAYRSEGRCRNRHFHHG